MWVREWELIGSLVKLAVRASVTRIETTVMGLRCYVLKRLPGEHRDNTGQRRIRSSRTCTPACRHRTNSHREAKRCEGVNVPETLRAAAHALSDRTDLEHATALAGLLHNRAYDMERNITI